MILRATPFHARAAEHNRRNAWVERGGFTLSSRYGDVGEEALAARLGVAVADISWRTRIHVKGAGAVDFLSRLLTRDPHALAPGTVTDALWLNDGGAVRGIASLTRYGAQSFVIATTAPDSRWIESASGFFDVRLNDLTGQEGGLALIGPYADALLCVAGLDVDIAPYTFRRFFWDGLDVTLARTDCGYELWCVADDAFIVWDRVMRGGVPFRACPAGLEATDILDLETGTLAAVRDFAPARDGFARDPSPAALGLEKFIDADHAGFNGRVAWKAARETRTLVGLQFDSNTPVPRGDLFRDGRAAGCILTSRYSFALRRAVALASVDRAAAVPGARLALAPFAQTLAEVAVLPFLPLAGPIAPVE